jgi:hypothetical protein
MSRPLTKEQKDAIIARELQEKYRLEFIQRQERKNHRARATAPPPSSNTAAFVVAPFDESPFLQVGIDDNNAGYDAIELMHSNEFEEFDAAAAQRRRRMVLLQQQEEEDAAFARRLAQEQQQPPISSSSSSSRNFIPPPHHNHHAQGDEALAQRLASRSASTFAAGASVRRNNHRGSRTSGTAATAAPGHGLSDEELARRLMHQEQLAASTIAPSFLPRSSAPGAERVMLSPLGLGVQVHPVRGKSVLGRKNSSKNDEKNDDAVMDADARMAQQLHDEELARRYGTANTTMPFSSSSSSRPAVATVAAIPAATRQGQQLQQQQQQQQQYQVHSGLAPHLSFFVDEQTDSDEYDDPAMAEARRVAQELEDEETARRYATYEQEAASRRQAQEMVAAQVQQVRRRHNVCYYLGFIPCCVIGCVVAFLLVFFVFGNRNVDDVPFAKDWGNFDDWIDIDPFDPAHADDDKVLGGSGNQGDPSQAFRWDNRGGQGLNLEILNALDDSWQTPFGVAVKNWEEGSPDALSLTTRKIAWEHECATVDGVMKVCNGNYGDTGWRGINEVLLNRRDNTITASAARMNEFYLQGGSTSDTAQQLLADQKLYTMCHEMGHGFGLPHWDENFYNNDLGNCMDYTNNPTANMQPSGSNYVFLADLYGSVDGMYIRNTTNPGGTLAPYSESVSSSQGSSSGSVEPGGDNKGGGGEKKDKEGKRQRSLEQQREPLPEWVIPASRRVREQVAASSSVSSSPTVSSWTRSLFFQASKQQQQHQQPSSSFYPPHRVLHENEFGKSIEVPLDDNEDFVVQYHFLF